MPKSKFPMTSAQGRGIKRVPDQTGEFTAPHMADEAHVVFTWPEPRPTVSIFVHGVSTTGPRVVIFPKADTRVVETEVRS